MCTDDTARIPLRARDRKTVRAYVIIDAADFAWASQWHWCLMAVGYAVRRATVNGRSEFFLLHRELMGLVKGDGLEVDHINHNKLDNRRANLRIVTRQGNRQNVASRRGSSSQYRGVAWDKAAGKWVAGIGINGKRKYLGYFTDEQEAAAVALAARREMLPDSVD